MFVCVFFLHKYSDYTYSIIWLSKCIMISITQVITMLCILLLHITLLFMIAVFVTISPVFLISLYEVTWKYWWHWNYRTSETQFNNHNKIRPNLGLSCSGWSSPLISGSITNACSSQLSLRMLTVLFCFFVCLSDGHIMWMLWIRCLCSVWIKVCKCFHDILKQWWFEEFSSHS